MCELCMSNEKRRWIQFSLTRIKAKCHSSFSSHLAWQDIRSLYITCTVFIYKRLYLCALCERAKKRLSECFSIRSALRIGNAIKTMYKVYKWVEKLCACVLTASTIRLATLFLHFGWILQFYSSCFEKNLLKMTGSRIISAETRAFFFRRREIKPRQISTWNRFYWNNPKGAKFIHSVELACIPIYPDFLTNYTQNSWINSTTAITTYQFGTLLAIVRYTRFERRINVM